MIIRVIDFETTGLPPDNAQIVEVATVDLVRLEHGVAPGPVTVSWMRGNMWSSLVNPGRPIPPEASAVHHITDDMVKDAPRLEDIGSQANATLFDDADVMAAHETKFEREVFRLAGGLIAHQAAQAKWICSRKCAVTAWPDAPNFKNQTLRYWLGLKLADASLALPHRALGDAYVTAAILRRLLELPGVTVDEAVEVSAGPVHLPKLFFGKHAMTPIADVPADYLSWILKKNDEGKRDGESEFTEDVLFTARLQLQLRREAARQRSPV